MIVWVSGPTGAGKSSLAQAFESLSYEVLQEKIPDGLFRKFMADPVAHCSSVQEAIMRSRFDRWMKLTSRERVIFDRSIDEDIMIFCKLHLKLGFLDQVQYQRLHNIADTLQKLLPRPDLILYVSPQRKQLSERVTAATHPAFIVQSLNRQLDLYSEWLANRREDVLHIDNSACKLSVLQGLFAGST